MMRWCCCFFFSFCHDVVVVVVFFALASYMSVGGYVWPARLPSPDIVPLARDGCLWRLLLAAVGTALHTSQPRTSPIHSAIVICAAGVSE